MYVTQEPHILVTVPELGWHDVPILIASDIIGTYYPFIMLDVRSCGNNAKVFHPPLGKFGEMNIKIVQGNGQPIDAASLVYAQYVPKDAGQLFDVFSNTFNQVFMLFEVDTLLPLAVPPVPMPAPDRMLFIDNYGAQREQTPFRFRYVLDEPCRNAASVRLLGLTCPHVDRPNAAFVRLRIINLSIEWVVPYGIWQCTGLSNVLVPSARLHTCDLAAAPATISYLDIELTSMDPGSGLFVPFVKDKDAASDTVCMTLQLTAGPR
jgi:hypothetical protein